MTPLTELQYREILQEYPAQFLGWAEDILAGKPAINADHEMLSGLGARELRERLICLTMNMTMNVAGVIPDTVQVICAAQALTLTSESLPAGRAKQIFSEEILSRLVPNKGSLQ